MNASVRPSEYALMTGAERGEFDELVAAANATLKTMRETTEPAIRVSCQARLDLLIARMGELQEQALLRASRLWKIRDPNLPEWLA